MSEHDSAPLSRGAKILKRIASFLNIDLDIKKSQEPIAEYLFSTEAKVRKPDWNYSTLFNGAIQSWVIRQIARAITQEVIVPEMKLVKRFTVRCESCGMEYGSQEEECQSCEGTSFYKPSLKQRKTAQELIDSPNPDYSFKELMRSALLWHILLDDTYLSIAYKYAVRKGVIQKIPSEVYVEDSRVTFPVADAYGHYGNDEYFCPNCYDSSSDDYHVPDEDGDIPTICPDCNGPLIQTWYVMQFGDSTKHRFGEDEIIFGATDRLLPSLHGNPKIISVWKQVLTINNMDDYNEEVYKEGATGGFVAFSGMDKGEVKDMKLRMQSEIKKNNRTDVVSGKRETSKKIRHFFVGVPDKLPAFIEIMPSPDKMQSLDFYKLYRDSICAVYGVTSIFAGTLESGKTGSNPRMQIDVQKGTTRENQQFLSSLWNDKVFPIFGVHDWEIEFGAIETVDELREAQVWEHKANAAQIWAGLGFEVTLDEHDALEVSREATQEPQPTGTDEPKPDTVSEESSDWLQPAPDTSPTKKAQDEYPQEARDLREELETKFLKILNQSRKKNDVKASYAEAKVVMDRVFKQIVDVSRIRLESTLKMELPELTPETLKKLRKIRTERLSDFRKLLNDELKRPKETKADVEKAMPKWLKSRAGIRNRLKMLVKDLVKRLWNSTNVESTKTIEEDSVEYEWITMGDERVCEICAPMTGKTYTQEQVNGISFPPHAACRCWMMVKRKKKE